MLITPTAYSIACQLVEEILLVWAIWMSIRNTTERAKMIHDVNKSPKLGKGFNIDLLEAIQSTVGISNIHVRTETKTK